MLGNDERRVHDAIRAGHFDKLDRNGRTPAAIAYLRHRDGLVDLLVEAGAVEPLAEQGRWFGRNPWFVRTGLRRAGVGATSLMTLLAIFVAFRACMNAAVGTGGSALGWILAGCVLASLLSVALSRGRKFVAFVGSGLLFLALLAIDVMLECDWRTSAISFGSFAALSVLSSSRNASPWPVIQVRRWVFESLGVAIVTLLVDLVGLVTTLCRGDSWLDGAVASVSALGVVWQMAMSVTILFANESTGLGSLVGLVLSALSAVLTLISIRFRETSTAFGLWLVGLPLVIVAISQGLRTRVAWRRSMGRFLEVLTISSTLGLVVDSFVALFIIYGSPGIDSEWKAAGIMFVYEIVCCPLAFAMAVEPSVRRPMMSADSLGRSWHEPQGFPTSSDEDELTLRLRLGK